MPEADQTTTFQVKLDRQEKYRFSADMGVEGAAPWIIDEPPPLGDGSGPSASRLLAAAVGHCLSASALFCLDKARIPVNGVHTEVTGTTHRNDQGRMRIGGMEVRIDIDVEPADRERMRRCLSLFEDFCVVTASVRSGIPVEVEVGAG